jgi:hypothetical protein
VDLGSAYLVRKYAQSPATADAANRIIKYFWNDIAAAYQSSTYQLAGPHSRSYGIDMTKYAAGLKWFLYLALDGKYPLQDVETDHDWDVGSLPILADLPVEVRPEFKMAPPEWREAVVEFRPKGGNRVIRQYRHGDLVLGTMSEQFVWQQQRNVVAYWPDHKPGGPVRFFQDVSPVTFGNGYAHQYTVQYKNAVLVALTGKSPVPAQGGMKLSFNADARAEQLPGGGYSVANGDVTTYVYPVTEKTNPVVVHPETDTLSLERPWNSGDVAGSFQVLGYLLVFRTAGDPAPSVKGIAYKSADGKASLSAEVDGNPLSLEVTR